MNYITSFGNGNVESLNGISPCRILIELLRAQQENRAQIANRPKICTYAIKGSSAFVSRAVAVAKSDGFFAHAKDSSVGISMCSTQESY
jgi:hypothetical protein